MALTFGNKQAYYPSADFLLGMSEFTFACWARIDTFSAGVRQALFGHTGSVDYVRFQKDTTDQWHCAVTSGGVQKQVWDSGADVVQGTIYHVAVTWKKADATGLRIFRNGAFVAATSTATQTGDYNAETGTALYLNGISDNNRLGYCSLENFLFWVDYAASDDEILALYRCGWPHFAVPTQPSIFWFCSGGSPNYIPDWSGNAYHIADAQIDDSPTDGGLLGRYEDGSQGSGSDLRQTAAGPPPPDDWTVWPNSIDHPDAEGTVTGLVNGTTYEFCMTAVDSAANESIESEIVEATPLAAPATIHVPRGRLYVRKV